MFFCMYKHIPTSLTLFTLQTSKVPCADLKHMMICLEVRIDAIGWHFGGYTGERRTRLSGCAIMHALARAQMHDMGWPSLSGVEFLAQAVIYKGSSIPRRSSTALHGEGIPHTMVPNCIWIQNAHTEKITVVLSSDRPRRLLTGGNAEGSPAGGGVGLNTAVRAPVPLSFTLRRA